MTDTTERPAAPPRALSPWRAIGPDARARRSPLLLGVGVLFVLVSIPFGFPTGRDVITAWVLLLLLAACGGEWPVWRRAVVHDWLPLIAVLFLYDFLRGAADELGGRLVDLPALANGKTGVDGTDYAHVLPQLRADEVLFGWLTGGQVPTVWLQEQLHVAGDVHWYDIAIVPVYMSHFLVPMVLAIALWLSAYHLFRRYVWTLVVLTLLTLATYALFPAAPPWMAGLNGYLPDVARVTSETLQATGIGTIRSAVARGEAYANAVAAIPSLHSAVPMMVLMFSWRLVPRTVRVLLALYVLAMTFTLTYGGEHYVVDAFIGWAYAAVAVYGVAWYFRRRDASDAEVEAGEVPVAVED
ncbi:MAG: phosphoesterase PA-phosphatase related protein [Frankiales bacterium]|nr:phosphoesterase PA-phosphatase related protein [Frankiales bacterium]